MGEYRIGADGLRMEIVNEWVEVKHLLLRRYAGTSRGAGAAYVDLYCGPGRCMVKATGVEFDGSPLVAADEALNYPHPFSEYHLADLDPKNVEAAATRLRARLAQAQSTAPIHTYVGPAAETARQIARALNRHGLHLVFLDPYGMEQLPFAILKRLSALERVDFLIHFSQLALQRNLPKALKNDPAESRIFEEFAPGWRGAVDMTANQTRQRNQYIQHWATQLVELGFNVTPDEQFRQVLGNQNQRLYWLTIASRHPLANEFWAKLQPDRQTSLF